MTVQRIGATAIATPLSTKGAPASGGAARLRPAALLYLCCVAVLAIGGGLLGVRLLQAGAPTPFLHTRPARVGVPAATSFRVGRGGGVPQVPRLTPKALAG